MVDAAGDEVLVAKPEFIDDDPVFRRRRGQQRRCAAMRVPVHRALDGPRRYPPSLEGAGWALYFAVTEGRHRTQRWEAQSKSIPRHRIHVPGSRSAMQDTSRMSGSPWKSALNPASKHVPLWPQKSPSTYKELARALRPLLSPKEQPVDHASP